MRVLASILFLCLLGLLVVSAILLPGRMTPQVTTRHTESVSDRETPVSPVKIQNGQVTSGEELRFSVATMWSLESTFFMYRNLVRRIARDVNRTDAFILRSSYGTLLNAIDAGEIDVAFICTGPYIELKESGMAEILVRPDFRGNLTYHSVILAPQSSPASGYEDMHNETIAFSDPESFTGCIIPFAEMQRRGIYPPDYFEEVLFTGNHELSISAVDRGLADFAAVHSIVWKSARKQDPELSERLKVIWSSPTYAAPPIVVRSDMSPGMKERLKRAFLELDEDVVGRKILSSLNIVRFRTPEPGEYEPAVQLFEKLRSNQKVTSWLSRNGH